MWAARSPRDSASRSAAERPAGRSAGAAVHVDRSPRGERLTSLAQLAGGRVAQRVIVGLHGFTDPAVIESDKAGWIDAYLADILDHEAHLYDDDITIYLQLNHQQAVLDAGIVLLHTGDHWNIQFPSGVTVETAPDGSCGAHAIHAALHLKDATQADVPPNYAAPADFVTAVRGSVHARLTGDRGEIAKRIAQGIQDHTAVAEAGFGPRLRAILTPLQEKAAREATTTTSGGASGSGWKPRDIDGGILTDLEIVRKGCGGLDIHDFDADPLNAQTKAAQYATYLENLRRQVQAFADDQASGRYVCIIRFYVKDENIGKTHPGLNSWAFLRGQQGKPVAETTDRKSVAKQHMEVGHDTDNAGLKDSPLVSGSYDAEALLAADSPFNTKSRDALVRDAGFKDTEDASGKGKAASQQPARGNLKDLRKAVLSKGPPPKPEATSGGPSTAPEKPKQEEAHASGAHFSQRIAILSHGVKSQVPHQTDEQFARALKLPIASHVAFMLVPRDMTELPPEGTKAEMCCILEKEITIFAPDIDLANFVVLEVANLLPKVTGRYGGPWQ